MLNFAKAIGANTDFLTAQAFVFPDSNNPGKLLVILLSGWGEDGFSKIRKVGLDCRDLFFESDQAIGDRFTTLVQQIKTELPDLEKIEGLIAFFEDNSLYLQTISNFPAFLLRSGSQISLTAGIESDKLISGSLQTGDKVLFMSPPLTENIDQKQLVESLLNSTPDNLEFELEAFLQQQVKSDPIAAVLVESYEEVVESSPEENQNQPVFEPPAAEMGKQFLARLPKISLPEIRVNFARLGLKRSLILAAVLIICLIILVNYWQKQSYKDKQFNVDLLQTQQNLDKASSLKDSDQAGAKQALAQAKNNLNQALVLKPKDQKALALQSSLQNQSYQILKQYQVTNFPVFLDLGLIKQGFSASKMSYSLGQVVLLDNTNKTLISLNLDQKLPQVLGGSFQLGDAQFATINGTNVFVFSSDKGILQIDTGNDKITNVIKPDPDWQRIVDIYGFANNIYLLDEFKNQIWKYIATTNGFSDKNNYLKVDVTADFAAARRLQIDGAVWVLKSDNKVLKFIQGGEDFFAFQGFDQDMATIKSFYSSDQTDNIYFLDNDNSRVVITQKNGQYVGEYLGDKFKTADDLVVDEKGKKMYLLEGNKIYLVNLQ